MEIIVLKTDINNQDRLKKADRLLSIHPKVNNWSVDLEDIDNVLRITSNGFLPEEEIISLFKQYEIVVQQFEEV